MAVEVEDLTAPRMMQVTHQLLHKNNLTEIMLEENLVKEALQVYKGKDSTNIN